MREGAQCPCTAPWAPTPSQWEGPRAGSAAAAGVRLPLAKLQCLLCTTQPARGGALAPAGNRGLTVARTAWIDVNSPSQSTQKLRKPKALFPGCLPHCPDCPARATMFPGHVGMATTLSGWESSCPLQDDLDLNKGYEGTCWAWAAVQLPLPLHALQRQTNRGLLFFCHPAQCQSFSVGFVTAMIQTRPLLFSQFFFPACTSCCTGDRHSALSNERQ